MGAAIVTNTGSLVIGSSNAAQQTTNLKIAGSAAASVMGNIAIQ